MLDYIQVSSWSKSEEGEEVGVLIKPVQQVSDWKYARDTFCEDEFQKGQAKRQQGADE